ncbi:AAA family ATPase [Parabacteroides sp.]
MIADIKFKNLLSFKEETLFSFEANNEKEMEEYHVVEVIPGVRLLKLAVVYGANASGKSNFIKISDFFKHFIVRVPPHKKEDTGIVPFLMDKECINQPSELSISFYNTIDQQTIKFVYSLVFTRSFIQNETLTYYPDQQSVTIFERTMEDNISTIRFGTKVKLSAAAKEEITLKCLPNMSVFAAYMQVNVSVPEMESVLNYFNKQVMPAVTPGLSLEKYSEQYLQQEETKDYILRYLKEADFNISNIVEKEDDTSFGVDMQFQHLVKNEEGKEVFYDFPALLESQGTIRTMRLAGCIKETIESNSFLAIDEIESSLHPKLIEYIIERFLRESEQAQMLITTHYDGLLGEDDLLRKDTIWFTEKNSNGATDLFPLTDFKGLNRISSLQKAYKLGKFGAVPNL